jgi:hypothetical protein
MCISSLLLLPRRERNVHCYIHWAGQPRGDRQAYRRAILIMISRVETRPSTTPVGLVTGGSPLGTVDLVPLAVQA